LRPTDSAVFDETPGPALGPQYPYRLCGATVPRARISLDKAEPQPPTPRSDPRQSEADARASEKSRSAGNPTFRQTKRTIKRWLCAKEQLLNWLKLEIFGTRRDPQAMTPLGKHRSSVQGFYNRLTDCLVTSEAAEKLVSRLQKNRNKMFTFLDFDDVPWNNNNAEHAVKAFASVRRVIEGPTTEKGLRDFLVLLSICETCKYKNVDFLGFLRSGTKDIDDFATNGWKQRVRGAKQRMDRQIET
jgi:transposase IS66 family protein